MRIDIDDFLTPDFYHDPQLLAHQALVKAIKPALERKADRLARYWRQAMLAINRGRIDNLRRSFANLEGEEEGLARGGIIPGRMQTLIEYALELRESIDPFVIEELVGMGCDVGPCLKTVPMSWRKALVATWKRIHAPVKMEQPA